MNIVVTGATSFLGTSLTKRLLLEGHRVYAVVRPGSKHLGALLEAVGQALEGERESVSRFQMLELSLSELDSLGERIDVSCPVYFHLGWDGSGSENRTKGDLQHKNIEDGKRALRGARSLGCRRFLFTGSQAEYGICKELQTEETECHPVSEYGKAKLLFGQEACAWLEQWKKEEPDAVPMEYIHTRIFSVYGSGDHPWTLVRSCLNTFLSGGSMELGDCTQYWNFLHVDDLVEGLLALAFCEKPLTKDGKGIYNLAGEESATMPLRQYVEQMYELCGRKGSFEYGLRKPNAEGQANLIPSTEKIRQQTGWRPCISFSEGIGQMIREMEERERNL